ncbi:chalcone isomerase family protein [Thaumasiovibrio subtropicus]|uniref:chalcone isomerase family protein n=1 Tax=Thaumasiovibrio subtropicus TaxID=1891207 RepID=UPI000B34D24F|nr:chalcone isomerase family protein [Thaumasiovibrio subtropicus]
MKRSKHLALVLVSLTYWLSPMTSYASSWQQWQTIGSATFTWGFWRVYESELRSPNGQYDVQGDIALTIEYKRSISKETLLEATADQWEHLGIDKALQSQWLAALAPLWPDVNEGDRLTFTLEESGQSEFWFADERLAVIEDSDLSRNFMAIWLSPDTAYPKMRTALIGTEP